MVSNFEILVKQGQWYTWYFFFNDYSHKELCNHENDYNHKDGIVRMTEAKIAQSVE